MTKQLQKDMDEQQEVHERLMVGRDLAGLEADVFCAQTQADLMAGLSKSIGEQPMKSYKSIDVFENVPGRGTIFMVNIPTDEQLPNHGEKILIDGMEYQLRYCEVGVGLFGRGKCVGLVVAKPIPAPQKQDLPQVDTKTPAEEIEALKAKVRELEGECEAWRKEAIGWRRQRNVSEYRYDIGGK